jgi:hypothetical protein
MSNRSAISVAALFASILTGVSFTSVTDVRAQAAADSCLTAPKDRTPEGKHWYYRLERGTRRQCWYLRGEDDKSARAAPQEPSADEAADATPAEPAAPPPRPVVRKSVANAHAELTSTQQRVAQEPAAAPEPRSVGMAPAPVLQNSPFPNAPAASAPDAASSSTVATRWPESSGVSSTSTFRTAAAEPPAAAPEATPAATQPAPAPVALAAADSSMTKQSASMQMLFLVMAGALTLAGIIASLIFRVGRARARKRSLEIRRERRATWDRIHSERPSPSMLPDEEVSMWRDERHDPRAADDPQRRVTEMLSRLARSAQN